MVADKLVHKINDASDAVADTKAMVWAVFYMAQGMRQDEATNAIAACCNQALSRLSAGDSILDAVADEERAKEGF